MILAIDIGNTNIVIGGADDNGIEFVSRMATDKCKTEDEYAIIIKGILNMRNISEKAAEGCIISSVVPPVTSVMKRAVKMLIGKTPLIVGPGLKTGLNIKMDNPSALGSDLVVNAVAGLAEYKPPLIVIDMGTATTMSVIDKNSCYIGGVIIPGMIISLNALSSKTSQLPHIDIAEPYNIIGKNTVECMKSGMIYATAAMIDGMIDRIKEELAQEAEVIVTGGVSEKIYPYCRRKIIYDSNLLLKGLYIIYKKNS